VASLLAAGRRRSLSLLEPVAEPDLRRQHSPLMSPLVWDLAHVGNYEDQWLVRGLGGAGVGPAYDDVYDAFRPPPPPPPARPLLGPAEARAYIASVRQRALDQLEKVDLGPDTDPLTAGAFVYGMVLQHEHQHDETMLATLQMMEGEGYRPLSPPPPPGRPAAAEEVLVEGGPFTMGTSTHPWAYDNEGPAHVVDLGPYWIDVAPVSNRSWAEFVEAGGYHQSRWWSAEGWAHRQAAGLEHPQYWTRQGPTSWSRCRFGWHEDLPADQPVQHVGWYEAEAYAAWRGKRLPTEAEWEKAAAFDPATGRSRPRPWGEQEPSPALANLGQRHFGPAPIGAYPAGASALGCGQMLGDVWEWTASDFTAYPGTRAFPYREYSKVFYGSGYKVLRGGSWATDPTAARTTFRNWDHAVRRQIFCGVRCARDA